jgi:heptaprenyl diphosphate synthase
MPSGGHGKILQVSVFCNLGGRMISLFGKDTCPQEGNGSSLGRILRPILPDLEAVQGRLAETLGDTHDKSVREVVDSLLEAPGKRVRPALALLSARAARGTGNGSPGLGRASLNVAAAVELIHMASLVHDDLVDAAMVRHHRPSVPAKWGKRVAAAVGDHLCGKAFRLVADCADPRLFAILGTPLCAMCEGELLQVAWRGNFNLSEDDCVAVVEKKTAALFSACCGAGAITTVREPAIYEALQKYGYHFGIAFQILDDCKDLLSDEERLGKTPGQDLLAGDVTLPLMYVVREFSRRDAGLLDLSRPATGECELTRLSEAFHSSPAPRKIAQLVALHVGQARQQLELLVDSGFKVSLQQLADHIARSISDVLAR